MILLLDCYSLGKEVLLLSLGLGEPPCDDSLKSVLAWGDKGFLGVAT